MSGDPRSGGGACPGDRCCPTLQKSDPHTPILSSCLSLWPFRCTLAPQSCVKPPRPSKRLGVWKFFRVMLNYIILLSCICFGEARHPGPNFDGVAIGTFNGTGLLGKGKLVNTLPWGLWSATETHLSKPGLAQFRRELKFCKSKQKFLTTSVAPLLSESLGSIGGKATGVGLLSSFPCRNLPCQWPPDLHQTGCVHAGAACINNSWIRVGSFYGFATCPKNKTTQEKSDNLLELLTDRIVHGSKGFRVISGDFNQPIRTLPQTEEWSKLGFVEIQEYAWQKWNRPVEFTCKAKSVRDYVWISAELIPFLDSVHTDDSWFADHSLLYAKFRSFDNPAPMPIWRKPLPLPWEICGSLHDVELPPQSSQETIAANSREQLQHLMHQVEELVDSKLRSMEQPGLLPNHWGRAATHEVTWRRDQTTPLKKGRDCDDAPTFTGENFQHSQWLRQLRRIRSLIRLHTVLPLSSVKLDQAWSVWTAIKEAPGFPGGFRAWWISRACVTVGSPSFLPRNLPPLPVLQSLYHNFQVEFAHFEETLKKHRILAGRERRLQDPSQIYRDIARPPAVPVQTLVVDHSCVIDSISSDHLVITFDAGRLNPSEPVMGPSGLLQCKSHEPGKIELAQDQALAVGDLLRQTPMCGSVSDVFAEFAHMWTCGIPFGINIRIHLLIFGTTLSPTEFP